MTLGAGGHSGRSPAAGLDDVAIVPLVLAVTAVVPVACLAWRATCIEFAGALPGE